MENQLEIGEQRPQKHRVPILKEIDSKTPGISKNTLPYYIRYIITNYKKTTNLLRS